MQHTPHYSKLIATFAFVCVFASSLFAQNVAINTDGSQPHSSAILDVKSFDRGLLIPRMNTVRRLAIEEPAVGLMVYDVTTSSFWYYDGSSWRDLNGGWSLQQVPIVKGIQEQQQQIDALKKENEELKKMVMQLMERIN